MSEVSTEVNPEFKLSRGYLSPENWDVSEIQDEGDNSELSEISDSPYEKESIAKSEKSIGDGIEWETLVREKNYSSKVLEITENFVRLEVLVNSASKEFKEKVFDKILFDNILDLEVGDFLILRIFQRPGKFSIEINDGNRVVNKEIFDDLSEFDYLDDISTPEIDLSSL